ncbi:cytidylyltransferase [Colletotrichum nymphaeae SA-01]|uniref:choline-phosphate cytidylyltransferase n=1 Tax=Colletotrichum nymphaeae SA-01 TaxID=1460502 RepID=A0A135UKY5_9PEZI|nr:cytidylyltransferase [Colletotrichum nymphaeae SA-01]
MASPILSQRTYRLSHIPSESSTSEIRQIFPSSVRDTIQYVSLARRIASTTPDDQVATVTFKAEPSFFSTLPYKFGGQLSAFICDLDVRFFCVWVDAHFHGLTTFNDLPDEDDGVDIIALTGLGGKAFASWQCYDGSMWLRDHIPWDVPKSRISIYGYPSDVGNSDSVATLSEMTETFVLDLLNYRRLHFPQNVSVRTFTIHLKTHKAWCRLGESGSALHAALHRSIHGLVFFGTPHNGMKVDNLLPGLSGQTSENLIRDIEPGSTYIKSLKERFSKATMGPNILSFLELRATPQSVLQPDGSILRIGKSAMNAPESTACLYWANEIRVPINENHSMIAKLAKRDGSAYCRVVSSIRQLLLDCRRDYSNQPLHDTRDIHKSYAIDTDAFDPSTRLNYRNPSIQSSHMSGENEDGLALLAYPPGFALSKPPANRRVRVLVHGIWNLFHFGHVRSLRFAKEAFLDVYLIVGVTADRPLRSFNCHTAMSSAERAEVVRACKYVDEVIDGCPPVLDPEAITKLGIDYFGYREGSFSVSLFDPYKLLSIQGKGFIIPRTLSISSTEIARKILRDGDLSIQ